MRHRKPTDTFPDLQLSGVFMTYPHFIAIDASSYDDDAHPIAIAWSMSDGQIKTTLIQPEDDWDDWDYALEDIHGISQETLYQRGETCWSVIRELENDIEESYLRTDDSGRVEHLLNMIYEACNREPSLETGPFHDGIPSPESARDANDQLVSQHVTCDDRVLLMLNAWVRADA